MADDSLAFTVRCPRCGGFMTKTDKAWQCVNGDYYELFVDVTLPSVEEMKDRRTS